MKNIIKWFVLLMHKDMQNFEMNEDTLDGGTHAIAIYNGQYVVVNDAMWDHWYNGKSSAFD